MFDGIPLKERRETPFPKTKPVMNLSQLLLFLNPQDCVIQSTAKGITRTKQMADFTAISRPQKTFRIERKLRALPAEYPKT